MGSKPPPLHPRLPGSQSAAGGSGGTKLEKVWATVSGRPGRTGRHQQALLFSECFSQFSGIVSQTVHLELPRTASWCPPPAHVAALSAWRASLTPACRQAGPSVQSRERTPGPTREGASGAAGAATAFPRIWETASPLPGLEGGGRTRPRSLEASPKPRTWVPWGTRPSSTWQGKMQLWSQTDLALVAV